MVCSRIWRCASKRDADGVTVTIFFFILRATNIGPPSVDRDHSLSAASRKYPGIRAPLHPLQLRCAPCAVLHSTPQSRALLARRIDALDASGYLRDATLG